MIQVASFISDLIKSCVIYRLESVAKLNVNLLKGDIFSQQEKS